MGPTKIGPMFPISVEAIRAAQTKIAPYIRRTPFLPCSPLSVRGREVWVKCENLQVMGSFKIRGATNCILENLTQAKKSGVVAASAGNHAQGVAAICRELGISATIVMPQDTPVIKLKATERLGAQIELHGQVLDESSQHAQELSQAQGFLYVPPYKDAHIIAGQGTIGLELLDEPNFAEMEAVVIPIGGGGLISGIATALREKYPKLKIYGVTAERAPGTYLSFKEKKVVAAPVAYTLADGVAVKKTDPDILKYLNKMVTDVFSVSDASIAHAIALLAEREKLVIEGSGAMPMAALIENLFPEKKIALVLSGGNIDLPAFSRVLNRGLVEQGRLVRVKVMISDRPGGLHALTKILADAEVSINQVFHRRDKLNLEIGETEVEIDLETKGQKHTDKALKTLEDAGHTVRRVY